MLRRTPLKVDPAKVRAWERRSRKPIAQLSPKGQARRQAWKELQLEVYARDGWCCRGRQLVPAVECRGVLDCHHILPRGRGGPDELANLVTLCRAHHDWAHEHPAGAKPLGLLA